MALTITHATVAVGTDANTGEIHKAEWNEAHSVSGTLSADDTVDGTTNKVFTATEKTKLANIEALADVTDAANVDAAGAVMNSDTSTAAMSFVVDEDGMASNSATKVPTQQSVKAYVDSSDSAYYTVAVARANHTGTQTASTISDFSSAADARIAAVIIDEDDMVSNSATKVPTQQSVKAYVDGASGGGGIPANVAYTAKTDTFTTTSTTWTDLTGLSVSITPSSASSRILIIAQVIGATSGTTTLMALKLVRGSTDVVLGDSDGSNRTETHSGIAQSSIGGVNLVAVDSPATTSATTYKVQCNMNTGTGYVNRDSTDNDNAARPRAVSTITVMEIV